MRHREYQIDLSERDDGTFAIVHKISSHAGGLELQLDAPKIFGPYRSEASQLLTSRLLSILARRERDCCGLPTGRHLAALAAVVAADTTQVVDILSNQLML